MSAFWTIEKGSLSMDFGGNAASHGGENGDDFIERAIKKYDERPAKRSGSCSSRSSG